MPDRLAIFMPISFLTPDTKEGLLYHGLYQGTTVRKNFLILSSNRTHLGMA